MKFLLAPQQILAPVLALTLVLVLLRLFFAAPIRTPPGFVAPTGIHLSNRGILAAEKEERLGINDLPLQDLYRYRAGNAAAENSDWEVELFYFESANASAEDFPEKYAPPRILSTETKAAINLRPNDNDRGTWLEGAIDGHRYFGARISPDGFCTITKSELWRRRRAQWRENPARLVRWLFSSQEIVDRRAVWLQMFADSTQPNDGDDDGKTRWREILAAFCPALRRSFAQQNGS